MSCHAHIPPGWTHGAICTVRDLLVQLLGESLSLFLRDGRDGDGLLVDRLGHFAEIIKERLWDELSVKANLAH